MLDSSLRTFLRRDVAADAVREVESPIRERVRETAAMPIFPNNVGVFTVNGEFRGAGLEFGLRPESVSHGWLLAGVCAVIAVVLLPVTHILGRKYLRRVQAAVRRRAEEGKIG
jgi:hypothetical protein